MHVHKPRLLDLALALVLVTACAKDGNRPAAPFEELHYPAWVGTTTAPGFADTLLVVNLDQDLAFDNGSLVGLDATATSSAAAPVQRGVQVPAMAGQLLVLDKDRADAEGCQAQGDFAPPFALVAGRTEDALFKIPLVGSLGAQATQVIGAGVERASKPFGVGLTCGADGTPRAWVGYQRGDGFVGQIELSKSPPEVVEVFVGEGSPRSFAYDRDRDRLYVSEKENAGHAFIRWLTVGNGCRRFDGGVQDTRQGGCYVDPGFDVSATLAGAEPSDIVLSSRRVTCTGPYAGQTACRRMFLSIRMYDAEVERALGERPSWDINGKLAVIDLPESSLGGPDPQWIRTIDIGKIAGPMLVIPRTGQADLVVVTAMDDALVWIYDDETGTMAKVFARDPRSGVPLLGHQPAGLAARDLKNGTFRVFVSAYEDNWVSAIDVPLADPASAYLVHEGADPKDTTKPILRLGVTP